MLFKLALRNLLVNYRRTFFTVSAIVLSSMLMLVALTWIAGVKTDFFSNFYKQYGHVRITGQAFAHKEKTDPFNNTLPDLPEVLAALKKCAAVRAVSPRINLGGLIDHKGNNERYPGMAISPDTAAAYLPYNGYVVSGNPLQAGKKQILVGKSIAEELQLKLGDEITLITNSRYDSISGLTLKVCGVADLNSDQQNKRFYIDLLSADYLLELDGDITEIAVYTDSLDGSKTLKKAILKDPFLSSPKYNVLAWYELPSVKPILAIIPVVLGFIMATVMLVAALAVLNPMLVSVMERRREIGILEALGFQKTAIVGMLVWEAVIIGVLGSLAGSLLGIPWSIYLTKVGVTIKSGAANGLPIAISNQVHGGFSLSLVGITILIGLGAALAGTLYPAVKAVIIQPVEAIHEK